MLLFRDGTSGFTCGLQRTTWKRTLLQLHVVGFALAVEHVIALWSGRNEVHLLRVP